jgi:hypothetical protein
MITAIGGIAKATTDITTAAATEYNRTTAQDRTNKPMAALGRPHPARPVPPETGTLTGGDYALFWSLSFAVRSALWRELGGFCEQDSGYGSEDTDFGQLAANRGVDLTWVGGAWACHLHHPSPGPARTAPPRHHPQRGSLPPPMGLVADDGWLHEFESGGLIAFEHRPQNWRTVSTWADAKRASSSACGLAGIHRWRSAGWSSTVRTMCRIPRRGRCGLGRAGGSGCAVALQAPVDFERSRVTGRPMGSASGW